VGGGGRWIKLEDKNKKGTRKKSEELSW